jgi:hypothetical protein
MQLNFWTKGYDGVFKTLHYLGGIKVEFFFYGHIFLWDGFHSRKEKDGAS